MKTVEIVESFTGTPASEDIHYRAGEVVEVSDKFADLIVGKGHAKLVGKADAAAKQENGE